MKKRARPIGRPRKSATEKRVRAYRVVFSQSECERIHELAGAQPIAVYLRRRGLCEPVGPTTS